ncbi:MAG: PTS transporter subunit EIIA [Oscillibacter sp.]|nr:PTS transporter subunit EIIA [Oscillibacter sp.]
MLERNQRDSVPIENNVAISHGTAESMKFVKRTGLVVLTYLDSIDWDGEKVQLVTCIAPKREEHLEILNCITEAAKTEADTGTLVKDASSEELYRKLNGLA